MLAISAIVYIFPKQGKFKYEFQSLKGKPWYHDDLIAPFDFAIKKSKDELGKERAEQINNAKYYFKYDESIGKEKKLQFSQQFESKWNNKNKK